MMPTGRDPALLPCITLHQPWASLCVLGIKRYETRVRPFPRRHEGQRIGIHAALRPPDLRELPDGLVTYLYSRYGNTRMWLASLPRGALLGTVVFQESHATDARRNTVSPLEVDCGNWMAGRFAMRLTDAHQFARPIPMRGQQGWFYVDPSS